MHDEVRAPATKPSDSDSTPAPWTKPELRELGDAKSLTQRVDNLGRNDGGRWPTRRT